MPTSVPIEEELVPYLGTNITGVDAWNESTQAGDLFEFRWPDASIPGISLRTEQWQVVQNMHGMHSCNLVIESHGSGMFAKHVAVIRYLRNRQGERGIFQPFSLTSYRVEDFVDVSSLPSSSGLLENHDILFRSTHRMKVKELNP